MLIGRRARRLNDEDIVAPNVLLDLDVGLAIGERADCRLAERHADVFTDAFCQIAVGGAGEDF